MNRVNRDIVKALVDELEYSSSDDSYKQWIMGISIETEIGDKEVIHIARVVVKTSTSPYVDGMDIVFTESGDTKEDTTVEMDPLFYEETPELQGSEIESALSWLRSDGREIIYLKV